MMEMMDKVVVIKELSIGGGTEAVSGEGLLIGGWEARNIGYGTGYGIRDLPIGPLQSRTSED
jgi:hypothetical protein